MARPERFELPTLCFEDNQGQNLKASFGVAYEPQGRLLIRTMIPRYLSAPKPRDIPVIIHTFCAI
jgi:hypothetical protein